jgi:hypothetical protein
MVDASNSVSLLTLSANICCSHAHMVLSNDTKLREGFGTKMVHADRVGVRVVFIHAAKDPHGPVVHDGRMTVSVGHHS